MAKKRLGRGLAAIYGDDVVAEVENERKAAVQGEKKASEIKTAETEAAETTPAETGTAKGRTAGKKTSGKRTAAGKAAGDKMSAGKTTGSKNAAAGRDDEKGREILVRISRIVPKEGQPRQSFDEDQMEELAESIRQHGVIQPLIVQKKGDFYEIITGERRWRAARMAGLTELPVLVRDYSDQESAEIALIENVQREDLNPIEEALAYQRLMNEFGMRQEEIAGRVSKDRTTITNSLRLLKLAPEVQQMVVDGTLTGGHARALLGLRSASAQRTLASQAAKKQMSVRETEAAVRRFNKKNEKGSEKGKAAKNRALDLAYEELEERLSAIVSSKVNIRHRNDKNGKIEIEYASQDELERIVELMESIREQH